MDNLSELAAALDKHEITGDEPVGDENPVEETATQEENKIEEPTEAEKPTESEVQEPKPEIEEDETQPVVDEEGKKYIPEKRFKEIYAKSKQAERRQKELEEQLKFVLTQSRGQSTTQPAQYTQPDKADALEVELLFSQYPQFNPSDPDYNEELDRIAAGLYRSGEVRTKLEAAKQAQKLASKLQNQVTSIKQEARTIKKAVAESVTARGGQRVEPTKDVDKMSADELESHLKATGQWLQ